MCVRLQAFTARIGLGDCPGAVEPDVIRLISPERREQLGDSARIGPDDFGDNYRVRVSKDGAQVLKMYADPGEDCGERARSAALFAVLRVIPSELGREA